MDAEDDALPRNARQPGDLVLLRHLARRGAYAALAADTGTHEEMEIRVSLQGETRVLSRVARARLAELVAQGLACARSNGSGVVLSREGRARLRRLLSASGAGGNTSCRQAGIGDARDPSSTAAPLVNDAESPLAWLARRKDKRGEPLISQHEFEAGERLRADFHLAAMSPRVTVDWSAVGSGHGRHRTAPTGALELSERVAAARDRVRRALGAVGPELAGILVDVCCHLKGLELAERAAGWPPRAGKVVLKLALGCLARHYGLLSPHSSGSAVGGRVRHWGAPGYRPTLD